MKHRFRQQHGGNHGNKAGMYNGMLAVSPVTMTPPPTAMTTDKGSTFPRIPTHSNTAPRKAGIGRKLASKSSTGAMGVSSITTRYSSTKPPQTQRALVNERLRRAGIPIVPYGERVPSNRPRHHSNQRQRASPGVEREEAEEEQNEVLYILVTIVTGVGIVTI